MKSSRMLGVVLALIMASPTMLLGEVFAANFEGATLNPFRSVSESAGGVLTFPSTARAFRGSQSVQLRSIPTLLAP